MTPFVQALLIHYLSIIRSSSVGHSSPQVFFGFVSPNPSCRAIDLDSSSGTSGEATSVSAAVLEEEEEHDNSSDEPQQHIDQVDPDCVLHTLNVCVTLGILFDEQLLEKGQKVLLARVEGEREWGSLRFRKYQIEQPRGRTSGNPK